MLAHLGEYAVRLFTMEEKYMRDAEYQGLEKQQEAHRYFAARFKEMYTEFQAAGLSQTLVDNLNNELTGWVRKHVMGMDQDFGAFYSKKKDFFNGNE